MARIKPHGWLEVIRPDAIAECWSGVSEDLYIALWRVVPKLKRYESEYPPEPDVNSVKSVWRHFSDDEKRQLNKLAADREARYLAKEDYYD